jgi:hypothetical protein
MAKVTRVPQSRTPAAVATFRGSRRIVLVGFAEALAGPEVAWSLVDAGFEVVVFARKGRRSALRHSRNVRVYEICAPEEDCHQARSDLEGLMSSLSDGPGATQVLFPIDDSALWLCSTASLNSHWLLAGPQGHQADVALKKDLQVKLALEAGFDVPQTSVIRTTKDLLEFAKLELLPIILKPLESVSVRRDRIAKCRSWICASRCEVERSVKEWGERVPLLAQPYLTGVGEGIFGLATRQGVRAWSAHKRLRMMNPQGSGSSACVSQAVAESLRLAAERLLQKCSWQGLFMIELLRDASGKAWFVELNGRSWGSMALSRHQGLEYPAWQAEVVLDPNSEGGIAAMPRDGVVCRNVGREIMHLLFVLRGPTSKAQRGWPTFWRALGEVLRPAREGGFYNCRRGDMKVFWADCYYSIHGNLFKPAQ